MDLWELKKTRLDKIELLDGSNLLTDTQDIVNKFADYFGSVGQMLDSQIGITDCSPVQYICRNPHSFYLFPVAHDELLKIISQLKCTKTDLNHIPVNIFKAIKHFFYK